MSLVDLFLYVYVIIHSNIMEYNKRGKSSLNIYDDIVADISSKRDNERSYGDSFSVSPPGCLTYTCIQQPCVSKGAVSSGG